MELSQRGGAGAGIPAAASAGAPGSSDRVPPTYGNARSSRGAPEQRHGRPAIGSQTIITAVNDPRQDIKNSGGWFGFRSQESVWTNQPPPPIDTTRYPNISRQDLAQYLNFVGGDEGRLRVFAQDRSSLEQGLQIGLAIEGNASMVQGDGLVQALQQVPPDYFQEDYSLERPGVIQALFECGDSEESINARMEDLSGYLDIVETQLMHEIAARSQNMFEAAAGLQDLHRTLCGTLTHIKDLRRHISKIDDATFTSALAVVNMQQRRKNLTEALEQLGGVDEVCVSKAALQCLLDSQDYAGALELLENLKHTVEGQVAEGMITFRQTIPQVEETIDVVENLLSCEFLSLAHIQDNDLGRMASTSYDMSIVEDQLQDSLFPVIMGLFRANKLHGVMLQLRENSCNEIKALIREVLERMLSPLLVSAGVHPMDLEAIMNSSRQQQGEGRGGPSGRGGDQHLGELLQRLPHSGFMQVLMVVYRVVEASLMHTSQLGVLIEDVLKGGKASTQALNQNKRDISSVIQSVSGVAQGRWVKLLHARTNSHARLKLYEFKGLLELSERFMGLADQLGAKHAAALRGALQTQCKAFMDSMHSKNTSQLMHLLEAEQWVAVEVPASFQQIVQRLVQRCDLPTAYVQAGSSSGAVEEQASGGQQGAREGGAGAPTPQLTLYLSLHDVVPLFGADIAQCTIELIKLFNTSTCNLVLAAGAMKTAGLKSISAKHLALSSQSIHMLALLLPGLRGVLVSSVSAPRRALLMPEFDRLMQDLALHMDEIYSKLVDIMQDRLLVAARALVGEAESWGKEKPPPGGSYPLSESIRQLSKQLGTLKAVLSPILQIDEVQYIFGRVASMFSETLAGTLDGLTSKGEVWEEHRKATTLDILQCFHSLPLDPARVSAYLSRLSTFYSRHYGSLPSDPRYQAAQSSARTTTAAAAATTPAEAAPHAPEPAAEVDDERPTEFETETVIEIPSAMYHAKSSTLLSYTAAPAAATGKDCDDISTSDGPPTNLPTNPTASTQPTMSVVGSEVGAEEPVTVSAGAGSAEVDSQPEARISGGGETPLDEVAGFGGGGEVPTGVAGTSSGGGEASVVEAVGPSGGEEASVVKVASSSGGGEAPVDEAVGYSGRGELTVGVDETYEGGGETSAHEVAGSSGGVEGGVVEAVSYSGGEEVPEDEVAGSSGGGELPVAVAGTSSGVASASVDEVKRSDGEAELLVEVSPDGPVEDGMGEASEEVAESSGIGDWGESTSAANASLAGDPLASDSILGDRQPADHQPSESLASIPLAVDPLADGSLADDSQAAYHEAVDPLTSDPLAGDPVVVDSLSSYPQAVDPLTSDLLGNDPLASDPPVADDPQAVEPLARDPLGSDSLAGEPAVVDSLAAHPHLIEPIASGPLVVDPLADDPLAVEPLTRDFLASAPVGSDPLSGNPQASEPVGSEPLAGDPPASDQLASEPRSRAPTTDDPVAGGPLDDDPLAPGVETVNGEEEAGQSSSSRVEFPSEGVAQEEDMPHGTADGSVADQVADNVAEAVGIDQHEPAEGVDVVEDVGGIGPDEEEPGDDVELPPDSATMHVTESEAGAEAVTSPSHKIATHAFLPMHEKGSSTSNERAAHTFSPTPEEGSSISNDAPTVSLSPWKASAPHATEPVVDDSDDPPQPSSPTPTACQPSTAGFPEASTPEASTPGTSTAVQQAQMMGDSETNPSTPEASIFMGGSAPPRLDSFNMADLQSPPSASGIGLTPLVRQVIEEATHSLFNSPADSRGGEVASPQMLEAAGVQPSGFSDGQGVKVDEVPSPQMLDAAGMQHSELSDSQGVRVDETSESVSAAVPHPIQSVDTFSMSNGHTPPTDGSHLDSGGGLHVFSSTQDEGMHENDIRKGASPGREDPAGEPICPRDGCEEEEGSLQGLRNKSKRESIGLSPDNSLGPQGALEESTSGMSQDLGVARDGPLDAVSQLPVGDQEDPFGMSRHLWVAQGGPVDDVYQVSVGGQEDVFAGMSQHIGDAQDGPLAGSLDPLGVADNTVGVVHSVVTLDDTVVRNIQASQARGTVAVEDELLAGVSEVPVSAQDDPLGSIVQIPEVEHIDPFASSVKRPEEQEGQGTGKSPLGEDGGLL
eukprot:gene27701-7343_t